MAKKKEPTFEDDLRELEEIVSRMETGDMDLAALMKNYSQGVTLAKRCKKALDDAENNIDLIVKDEGVTHCVEPLKIF